MPAHPPPLLQICDLVVEFGPVAQPLRAVDGVCLEVNAGETVCLVGESGCGKSLTALSIARLVPSPPARCSGAMRLEGRDVFKMDRQELRSVRGRGVSYVFQEPAAFLNPVYRVGDQIMEPLKLHRPEMAAEAEIIRLLKLVGIPAPDARLRDYPHQLSGGMQQRIMIAMALAAAPKLLVADEPTTALDVTVQAQILELLGELKQRLGMSMLLITHNLNIVAEIADRVAVMYAGQIVESGPARQILSRPGHPYTRALLQSIPKLDQNAERLQSIPGHVPALSHMPSGCRFHPRCEQARPECAQSNPALKTVRDQRQVRCPFSGLEEVAQ